MTSTGGVFHRQLMLNNNIGGRRSSLPSVLRKRPSTPTTPHLHPGLQREE